MKPFFWIEKHHSKLHIPFGKNVRYTLSLLLLLQCFIEMADAHKVYIYAWVEGDTVYTESSFGGKKVVLNSTVTVFDMAGNKLTEGTTDAKGRFSFKVPQKTEMKIVLDAGMGHAATWIIPAEEFEPNQVENVPSTMPSAIDKITESKKDDQVTAKTETQMTSSDLSAPCRQASSTDLQMAVEKALDKKLAPVLSKLNRYMNEPQGPTVHDILSGIGYILGLVGIGTYFNYRNKNRKE